MKTPSTDPTAPWDPPTPAAKRYENLLVVILFLAFGFVFFDRQAVPFLAPFFIDELQLTNTQLGTITGVLALTWALSGMFVGKLSDKLGVRKPILVIAVIVFSAFSSLSGFAGGFLGLLLLRALMGLAEGAVLPMAQSLMIESSQVHRRGLNMGLVQGSSAGLFGGIIAPPVVVLLAEQFGWRVAFYVTIIPGLLIALWIWKAVQDRPPMSPMMSADGKWVETAEHKPTVREVLKERNIMLCMIIAVFYLTWFVLIITFAPLYMVEVKGFSPGTMANVMIFFGVAWVLWGAATPAISDRVGRKPALIGFTVLAALCPFVIMYVPSPVALAILAVFTYTGLGCFTLFMATIPAETVSHGALATALGIVMGVGELAGGFIAPIIAGVASDAWGLQAAMFMAGGGAILVVLLAFGLHETAPRVLVRRGFQHPEVPGAVETEHPTQSRPAPGETRK
jgi:MFS family permease